ncbi:MAG: hypothetical protein JWL76_993 [Thermoleophilia bacterium]|nr:hypothetical protein [Thermoleophilia bacterium]
MHHAPMSRTNAPGANIAAAAIAGAVTLTAIFVLGRLSENASQHATMVLGAMSISVLVLWFGLREDHAMRAWALGGIVATLGLGLLVGGVLARPSTVDEQVVTAGPVAMHAAKDAMMAADDEKMTATDDQKMMAKDENVLVSSGSFKPLAHSGRGTASIIRTTDGTNVLTLTGFETDAGPDLVVMLVAGDPANDTDVEAGTSLRLGRLKGTSGDQQYVLPTDADPADFTHAYIWCRAFSVGFTRARLA